MIRDIPHSETNKPNAVAPTPIDTAIEDWRSAYAEYKTLFDADGDDHDEEWQASERAETAMIYHPCLTIEDVRSKARIAIEDENVMDSLLNCKFKGERMIVGFLRSLLGENGYPADKEGGEA